MCAREQVSPHAVALIELGDSHVECIYSQLLFLHQAGYDVHLVCSEGMREQVSAFSHVHRFVFLDKGAGVVGHWRCVRTVLRYLKENAIGTVLFNTGSGNHTRDISLFAPRGVHLVGLIHHTHKLKGSFTQKLISLRVRRCFVLNDYLLNAVPPSRRKHFTSVYLIFREPVHAVDVRKEPGTLWVAIPGQVDFRRRDYRALVEELQRSGEVRSFRFFVLGECKDEGDGGTLRAMLREAGLEQQVTLFDRFLDRETFFGYVLQCDLLLPLIHPSTHFFSHYARFQISGTYNLAFGLAKPLLLHSALKGPEDFEIAARFYKDGELLKLLEHFAAHRDEVQAIGKRIREAPKFSFAVQCDRYMRLLQRQRCNENSPWLTPALRAVKHTFPSCFVAVLVVERYTPLEDDLPELSVLVAAPRQRARRVLGLNPYVDELLIVARNRLRALRGIERQRAELAIVRSIRHFRFDTVINTWPADRFSLWAFLSGAPRRVGQRNTNFHILLTHTPEIEKADRGILEYYSDLARATGARIESLETELTISPSERQL